MPTATEILRHEHEHILWMLDIMDAVSRRLDADPTAGGDALAQIVDFFATFADRCHHAKEEEILFPRLEEAGIPRAGGPIGCMLEEHDLGRKQVAAMQEGVAARSAGDVAAVGRWQGAAAEFGALLRDHINKENQVLFPMAEQMVDPDELTALASRFDDVERAVGEGVHERMHQLLETLAAAYGVEKAAVEY